MAASLAACLLRLALNPLWGGSFAFIFFLPTTLFVSLLGGLGPGIVSVVLSFATAALFIVPPHSLANGVGLAAYVAVDLLVALASSAHRTALRMAEESRMREEYLTLFREAPGLYAIFDRDMRYLSVSNGFVEAYGLTARYGSSAALIGRSHYEVFPEIGEEWRAIHRRCLAGAVERRDEDRFDRADGRTDWIRWELRPWRRRHGSIGGIILYSDVVTGRVNAEHALRESEERCRIAAAEAVRANAAKSQFLASMSHELRTPLNAVIGFVQLLGHIKDPLTERQREYLAVIERASDHLLGLIDEVLDLAKIEAGGASLQVEPVQPGPVLDELCALLEPAARAAEVALTIDGGAAMAPPVVADRGRLLQILTNLGSNGIKYNHAGGSVRIEARLVEGGRVRFAVVDSGVGIAPEHQRDIFQPFNRAGAEHSGVKGSGIGLAISKRLAELLGGRMGFESRLGEGSTFWLELPAAASLEALEPAAALPA